MRNKGILTKYLEEKCLALNQERNEANEKNKKLYYRIAELEILLLKAVKLRELIVESNGAYSDEELGATDLDNEIRSILKRKDYPEKLVDK